MCVILPHHHHRSTSWLAVQKIDHHEATLLVCRPLILLSWGNNEDRFPHQKTIYHLLTKHLPSSTTAPASRNIPQMHHLLLQNSNVYFTCLQEAYILSTPTFELERQDIPLSGVQEDYSSWTRQMKTLIQYSFFHYSVSMFYCESSRILNSNNSPHVIISYNLNVAAAQAMNSPPTSSIFGAIGERKLYQISYNEQLQHYHVFVYE